MNNSINSFGIFSGISNSYNSASSTNPIAKNDKPINFNFSNKASCEQVKGPTANYNAVDADLQKSGRSLFLEGYC